MNNFCGWSHPLYYYYLFFLPLFCTRMMTWYFYMVYWPSWDHYLTMSPFLWCEIISIQKYTVFNSVVLLFVCTTWCSEVRCMSIYSGSPATITSSLELSKNRIILPSTTPSQKSPSISISLRIFYRKWAWTADAGWCLIDTVVCQKIGRYFTVNLESWGISFLISIKWHKNLKTYCWLQSERCSF